MTIVWRPRNDADTVAAKYSFFQHEGCQMDAINDDPFIVTHGHIATFRNGRNPRDGYDRGAGLKYRGLAQKIAAQTDFQEAAEFTRDRSLVTPDRLMNLYMLIRFYLPKLAHGDIIEYGCFRGGSAMFMAKLAERYLPGVQVYGLDTFAGLPEGDSSIDGLPTGEFASNYEEVTESARAAGLTNLHFTRGLFSDTAALVLSLCRTVKMIHIDCDLYEPVQFAYDVSKPHLVPGGYVVFDDATDATCLGAMEAIESTLVQRDRLHAEQVDPHFVFRYPPLQG